MTEQELIQRIKELKKIQPSQQWLDLARHNLITQISFKEESLKPKAGFLNWLKEPQSIALVICLILIFIGGPWLVVKASQASLPGELLYPVKRITEEVQTTVASKDSKVQLQTEFAFRRLEELTKIAEDPFFPEEKTEKAKQVISDFRGNLAGISQHVSKISKEQAVAVAKKTKKLKEDLNKTKEEVPLDVKDDLAEAEKVIEEINHQILAALTKDSQESAEGTATTTLDQEVLIFLKEIEPGVMTTTEEIINDIKK
jgi:hypothetical protein